MKRFVLIATVLQASLLAGAPALAAAPLPPNAAEASKHFERGLTLVDDEDWSSALVEFQRAYDLDPNFRVLFDIGQCRYQLHDYPDALHAFQRYLSDGGDAVPPDRRSKVQADVELLKGRVATVRISSTAAGAQVSVDDAVVGTTPLADALLVSAGVHRIVLRPPGGPEVTREVTVAGEEHADVALDPVPTPAPVAGVASVADATPPAPAGDPSLVPAWVALGVGVAGAAAGTYFGVAAIDDKNRLEAQCAGKVCALSSQSLLSRAHGEALGSTIGVAVGAAGLVTGGLYIVFTRSKHNPQKPAMGLVVGPGTLAGKWSF